MDTCTLAPVHFQSITVVEHMNTGVWLHTVGFSWNTGSYANGANNINKSAILFR